MNHIFRSSLGLARHACGTLTEIRGDRNSSLENSRDLAARDFYGRREAGTTVGIEVRGDTGPQPLRSKPGQTDHVFSFELSGCSIASKTLPTEARGERLIVARRQVECG